MADLTLSVDQEEFAGLVAIGELDAAAGEAGPDVGLIAKRLLRSALASRLGELGLPWSPPADDVAARVAAAAAAGPPEQGLAAVIRRPRVRRWGLSFLAVIVLVLLWGGYVLGWRWTGFQANAQVWDWMHLLLLPVVVGTIPLWLERPAEVSRARQLTYWALMAAFVVFAVAGYLVPLPWTGFAGITLWDWFGLILLPAAVASARLFPAVVTALRPHHRAVFGLAAAGWLATVIGGYSLGWKWTGYPGNTLWDWLQMLLLPLIVPIILVPAALKWVSGTGAGAAGPAPAPAPDAWPRQDRPGQDRPRPDGPGQDEVAAGKRRDPARWYTGAGLTAR